MRLFIWLFAVATLAMAQTDNAGIAGLVTDTSGAAVPKAKIVVKNQRTGVARETTSNDDGTFAVVHLAPAVYDVTGSAEGLGPTETRDVRLTVGQERSLTIVLQPSAMTQEVTVSGGELVTIDTSSARVGANVNEREVQNMPLNGRQLSQLYLMAPGAQTAGGGSYDNIRFSGRANQQNAIRFDGVEASSIVDASPGNLNGETSTGLRLQSSLENVQEFRVDSSNYPAEYGTGTGGQISIVTKSGGNEFHGSLFEYVRNNKFDARNFFDAAKSPLRLNQYGGSLGGPIRKDKAFFFASVEALRQRAGINLLSTVPSAAARARAVPSIRPLLDVFPTGQESTANPDLDLARLNASTSVDEYYGGLRLDYNFNPNYVLTARYFRDQGEINSPMDVSGSTQRVYANPQNGVLSLQQVIRPSVLNETKFGFNGAKTRINGVAPSVNGIDVSALSARSATLPPVRPSASSGCSASTWPTWGSAMATASPPPPNAVRWPMWPTATARASNA